SVMAELGAYIFEADDEAKKMITENSTVQSELIAEFGTDIMGAGNVMDLQKLGRIALQDEDHQMRLNSVVHPYIYNLIDDQFNKISEKNKHSMFVVDAALIYESGYDQHLDYVIVITALMKNRMERTIARGTLTRQQILKRIDLQWSEEEKTGLADFVIHNDGTEEDLQKEIKEIYNRIV
ncbi:MAG TPA: dephospho-CoA kinase, partial [Candidatus Marinimicrobia bacterium]|nr:dephospho-CoA kinase [Candidatus Neomarinimicrobiota bacterium]